MDTPYAASVPTGDETTVKTAAKDHSRDMADGASILHSITYYYLLLPCPAHLGFSAFSSSGEVANQRQPNFSPDLFFSESNLRGDPKGS